MTLSMVAPGARAKLQRHAVDAGPAQPSPRHRQRRGKAAIERSAARVTSVSACAARSWPQTSVSAIQPGRLRRAGTGGTDESRIAFEGRFAHRHPPDPRLRRDRLIGRTRHGRGLLGASGGQGSRLSVAVRDSPIDLKQEPVKLCLGQG